MKFLQNTDRIFFFFLSCFVSVKLTITLQLVNDDKRSLNEEYPQSSTFFFYQQLEYPRDCKEAVAHCSSSESSGVYLIKPVGYPKPFEVYCNNSVGSGGWTVIQRRSDMSLPFQRDWNDYKSGFGFWSTEFWIGNDKLSYLTNQATCELRVDMVMFNGSSFYINYDSFRISDEMNQYSLVNTGSYSGNASCVISDCLPHMISDGCICQKSCSGIRECHDDCFETCVCADGFQNSRDNSSCVPLTGCLVPETDAVIPNGRIYVNENCTVKCTCNDNQIYCNYSYECSSNAACMVKNRLRQCYCDETFQGDGETCNHAFTDCYDAFEAGHTDDGVYTILPTGWQWSPFNVSCDMNTDGGGWTVFQRRIDGVTDFYRYWEDYKLGFGSLDQGKDFWLGNEQLYYLTNQRTYKMRVNIVNSEGALYHNEFSSFKIDDESMKYRLSIGSGNTGRTSLYYNNGGSFSTPDQDNDGCSYHHCAEGHRGGWWYNTAIFTPWCQECRLSYSLCYYFETRPNCINQCTQSNLNGVYNGTNGERIFYDMYCDNFVEMKIRPSI